MRLAEFLIEGGNVFSGQTAAIKREHIAPTLAAYFAELKSLFPQKAKIFTEKIFEPLGSVGKKAISGDIDLGVDTQNLVGKQMTDADIRAWNLEPADVETEFLALKKRARTANDAQLRMKAFLKTLVQYINQNSTVLHCDEKKVTDGNIFGLFTQKDEQGEDLGINVQIDWMVGNINWLRFSYYSTAYPADSNVKGLHRTQLMLSAFQVANMTFNHVTGVKDKTTGEVLATDPKQALTVLGKALRFKITADDAENYYQLHKLLKSKMTSEQYDHLTNVYFRILDSTRTDIPDDLQPLWIQKQSALGLTGKFLPDTSKLIQYQTEKAQ